MTPHRHPDILKAKVSGLYIALSISLMCSAGLWYGWHTAPERLWIDFPPDLSRGNSVRPGDRNPINIYSFAWMIMGKLNQWDKDGKNDFPTQIESFRTYITPKGEEQLVSLLNCKSQLKELSGRQRNINLVDFYGPDSVKQFGNSAWLVTMRFEILERVSGMVTKQPTLKFEMWFVNYRPDPDKNPWQLGFGGFENFNEITGGKCNET